MRISDWSSDVCSSDLHEQPDDPGEAEFAEVAREIIGAERRAPPTLGVSPRNDRRGERMLKGPAEAGDEQQHQQRGKAGRKSQPDEGKAGDRRTGRKIGRASCRERVCQYV